MTAHPNGAWVTQQARNLLLLLGDQGPGQLRVLFRDRDAKFTRAFDDVFRSDGADVRITPVQAPNANAYAERWIRTGPGRVPGLAADRWVRPPGAGPSGLREHYNVYRPHRALRLEPPDPPAGPTVISENRRRVYRRDRLDGLLHEYFRQAA